MGLPPNRVTPIAFDLESVAIDISEDLPLESTEEDFTEALAGGLADGTLIASESDSDSYDE